MVDAREGHLKRLYTRSWGSVRAVLGSPVPPESTQRNLENIV